MQKAISGTVLALLLAGQAGATETAPSPSAPASAPPATEAATPQAKPAKAPGKLRKVLRGGDRAVTGAAAGPNQLIGLAMTSSVLAAAATVTAVAVRAEQNEDDPVSP